jgi:alcohol dehydrogenase
MRAVVMKAYGGNEVVETVDLPKPAIGPGDVLVEVHAASVNPVDFKIREGKLKQILPYRLPLIMGNDLSGVVAEVAPGVTSVKVGDAVYARLEKHRPGTFAEYAAVRAVDLAPKPARLTHEEAASIPLVGLTAWQALVDRAHLEKGQKVLIHAGSGGVGTIAIQIAKHLGATVATTCSARNVELVKSLGADVVVDYGKERLEDVLRDYDVVLDTLGGETLMRSFDVLRRGGVLVTVSGPPDAKFGRAWGVSAPVRWAMAALSWTTRRRAAKRGVAYEFLFMEPSGAQLATLAGLIDAGTIRPVVDRVFPLAETKEALAYSETGKARGKIVIRVRAEGMSLDKGRVGS